MGADAYILAFAVLMLTAAALGDRYGRRRVFIGRRRVFTLPRRPARWPPNAGALIAARAVRASAAR